MNQINFIIQTISKHSNVTSFIKSMQYNDRYGCVTVEGGERFYPELVNGKTVSMFLKELYKSIKSLVSENNQAVEEIVNKLEIVEEIKNEIVNEVTGDNKGDVKMTNLITKALQSAGYDSEPTEANLIQCYLDYADAYGGDIDDIREDIASGDITVKQMCNALIRCN